MITRIEIDGFKTFDKFELDLQPFTAIVGPNASGKSNLFDALRFLSLLARSDIRTAMQGLRGEPEELFRKTAQGSATRMKFAVEVILGNLGIDDFGKVYQVKAQRLRYELALETRARFSGMISGIYVVEEKCVQIPRSKDRSVYAKNLVNTVSYRKTPFLNTEYAKGRANAFEIRQDGEVESGISKRGRPLRLAAEEATRTALSTVTTAEFPHLYALRRELLSIQFLEINPTAARSANDRFEDKQLRPDASNLAATLANLQEMTADDDRPGGVLSDISLDLSSLIPNAKRVKVDAGPNAREYSFSVETVDNLSFSSRVISDGTLRLLALLTILNDPLRFGILCFEEPENGVHEGRIPALVELLRSAAKPDDSDYDYFQVIINTHSPAVLLSLSDDEIVVADLVNTVDSKAGTQSTCTRMRKGVQSGILDFHSDQMLTRAEIDRLLKRSGVA